MYVCTICSIHSLESVDLFHYINYLLKFKYRHECYSEKLFPHHHPGIPCLFMPLPQLCVEIGEHGNTFWRKCISYVIYYTIKVLRCTV